MANKTIILRGPHNSFEGIASETVTPGHLVEFGGSNDIQKHSTQGGNVMPMFARENDIVGDDIDTDYSSGENLLYDAVGTGGEVYAWLVDGENVSKGDFLESNGDGTLRKLVETSSASDGTLGSSETVYSNKVVGVALEAVDLSASANTSNARIKVRIA